MKKLFALSIFLITTSLYANSQNVFPIKYEDCNTSQFFLEGREVYTKIKNDKLLHDLIKNIDKRILHKIKGEIYFQIVVDTTGNHCCVSIKNDLNKNGKNIPFKEIMDSQTSWSIPIREGKKASVSAMVKMKFEKDKIILTRLGFNGKVGWIELSKYIFKNN